MSLGHYEITVDGIMEEFVAPEGHCGLCGNIGTIDTRATAVTEAGHRVGGVFFCICPNGRSLRMNGFEACHVHETFIIRQRRERKGDRRIQN